MSHNYSFFPRTINDKPHSVRVNMDSNDFLKKQPHLMIINVPYEERDDGFPRHEEFDRINNIEDALDHALASKGVNHIGAITGNGTVIHFYALESMDGVSKYVKNAFGDALRPDIREDEAISCYYEFLSPNLYEKNYISNQEVCQSLEASGEKFETERDVDFYTYFKDLDQANQYASHFSDFAHTINVKKDEAKYCVHLIAKIIPSLGFMNGITDSILDLTDVYEGDFDGWGTTVES